MLDGDRLRAAQPTHTVFNGVHNGMVKTPLAAKPGERVRLYVLNVGPSKTSSFHVVGTIFDRVWIEGNPDNQFRGMQTVLLGSSNSADGRVRDPRSGLLHHGRPPLRQRVAGRARAHLDRGQATRRRSSSTTTSRPRPRRPIPRPLRGKLDFESKCLACHSVGEGKKLGPDLDGVTKRRSDAWLTRWLKAPEKMLETDADAKTMLKEFNNLPMPNQSLSDAEIKQYIKYFHWIDAQPAGSVKASGGH